ncbi:HD domain-containing protein [uncultured Mitsuokella sp.]|uniref:HD domain-containing protein n=1 Tax=uncultured Mitsuokella sp. TaxID=453120 RepID=UPI002626A325|nr:HD domain-containing protein [uncultured Mitsuokella sp.]
MFYAMHRSDQVHAINVARTALEIAKEYPREVNRTLLLRVALLHDVGRRKGDLDIWGKVFAVLAMKFFPCIAEHLMQARKGTILYRFGHALYVSKCHAAIGAGQLREMRLLTEASIVARHHLPPDDHDAAELIILRMADERN